MPLNVHMKLSLRVLVFAIMLTSLFAGAQDAPKRGKAKSAGGDYALPPDAHALNIGDAAPDFSLRGVDGKIHKLADFKDAKALMVIFLSNHCPYSHAAENRLLPLAAEMKSRGLAVVAINPNHPDAVRIDELGYSKYNDSFDEMKLYAKEKGFTFPYLYDGDTQATAKAYGCLARRMFFLFDRGGGCATWGALTIRVFPIPPPSLRPTRATRWRRCSPASLWPSR
jgi:peroxiredoxin